MRHSYSQHFLCAGAFSPHHDSIIISILQRGNPSFLVCLIPSWVPRVQWMDLAGKGRWGKLGVGVGGGHLLKENSELQKPKNSTPGYRLQAQPFSRSPRGQSDRSPSDRARARDRY